MGCSDLTRNKVLNTYGIDAGVTRMQNAIPNFQEPPNHSEESFSDWCCEWFMRHLRNEGKGSYEAAASWLDDNVRPRYPVMVRLQKWLVCSSSLFQGKQMCLQG